MLPKSEGRTHRKDTITDTSRKKLTLVIWTPKLEGFAFNTSAENVTSQRKKESKNITRVEERKRKPKNQQASMTRELWRSVPATLQSRGTGGAGVCSRDTRTRTDTAMIPPGTAELLSPGQVKGSRVLWCVLNVEEEIFFQEEGKKIIK